MDEEDEGVLPKDSSARSGDTARSSGATSSGARGPVAEVEEEEDEGTDDDDMGDRRGTVSDATKLSGASGEAGQAAAGSGENTSESLHGSGMGGEGAGTPCGTGDEEEEGAVAGGEKDTSESLHGSGMGGGGAGTPCGTGDEEEGAGEKEVSESQRHAGVHNGAQSGSIAETVDDTEADAEEDRKRSSSEAGPSSGPTRASKRHRAASKVVVTNLRAEPERLATDLFSCALEEFPTVMEEYGLASLRIASIRRRITRLVVAAAEEHLRGPKSVAIFQEAVLDKDGNPASDGRRLKVSKGTEQRMQASVAPDSGAPEALLAFVAATAGDIEAQVLPALRSMHPGVELVLHPANILGNRPIKGMPPVGRQVLHVDNKFGAVGYIIILALVPETTLLVAPGSQAWVIRYSKYYNAKGAAAQKAMDALEAIMPSFSVVRLCLQPGELVVLHGNTVHAGDAGRKGAWAPCLHWYVQAGETVEDETFLLHMLGKPFTDKFVVPGST